MASVRCLVLALGLLATNVPAAVVHRCQLADGTFAYRDTGCLAGESLVSRLAYDTSMPAAPAPHAARETARDATRTAPRPPPRDLRIVAHECRFGEQRWIQAQPCPAKMQGDPTPVHETRLTRAQTCTALRHLTAASAPGEGSARRAYGMNRLRQRHGC